MAAAALALSLHATPARAHGGFFRADELRIDPSDETHMIVRSDVWGMIETKDGAKTWKWTCAAATLGKDVNVNREPFVMLPGGRIIMESPTLGSQVVRSVGSLCDVEVVPFFAKPDCSPNRCVPYDIAQESPSSNTVIVLTTSPIAANDYVSALWRSTDGGDTWTDMGATLASNRYPVSVAIAPSNPAVMYVASSDALANPTFYLHRSQDAAHTFSESTVPITLGPEDKPGRIRFCGVHPNDSGLVFLWFDEDSTDQNAKAPDRLLVSADGGVTVTEVFRATNDLPGFALTPDGASVFIGGTDDGLWSATVSDLKAGKTGAFHRVNSGNTWSLAFTKAGLFAGREEFVVEAGTQRMTLGMSKDLGVSFDSALDICDVAPAECDKGTPADNACGDLYFGDGNFQFDQQLRRCASEPVQHTDAGAKPTPAPPSSSGGCACRLGTGAGTRSADDATSGAAAIVALCVAALRRTLGAPASRRPRRSPRTG